MSSPTSHSADQPSDPDIAANCTAPVDSPPQKTTASVSSLSHHLLRLAEKMSTPLQHKTNDVVVSLDVYHHDERIKIRIHMAVEVIQTFTKSQLYTILFNVISNNLWTETLVVSDPRFYALRVQVVSMHANGLEVVLNNEEMDS